MNWMAVRWILYGSGVNCMAVGWIGWLWYEFGQLLDGLDGCGMDWMAVRLIR